ncbi:hypothetical protein LOK46_07580 [Methylobacterium sp. NMS14P]|uniref:hypothetical protein n=1 Tax=Methylobacterium sp. NMS14P TaxID=2894310 RepID=UPI0023584DFE|nr:hypothetical protein [Methylobacterium sp. NMS14P]WCS26679.1 hypothetical protein LOK46_07580 [Methylobacterium sp. NMS14P]
MHQRLPNAPRFAATRPRRRAGARALGSALCLPLCLPLCLSLGLALPARAEVESKTARPGQRIFLQGFTYYFATQGCRSRAATIELVRPPRGGRVEQRREFRILSAKVDETGAQIRQPDGCEDAKKDSMSLYYTARPDFSGLDTLSIDVTFGDGSTVPYTFRITVPPGEPRRAPAVSEVPIPRAGDAGQAAPAARAIPAPASREAGTSTGDFLRDTVRGSVAEPPKSEAAASGAAPQTEPAAPRAMAPPPRARPPAAPQL